MSDSLHIVCPHCHSTNRIPSSRDPLQAKCGQCKQLLFDGRPATLDTSNLDRHINKSDIPLVVDFWAEWCGPCKTMEPVFEQTAKTLQPSVQFAKVDTDENQHLMARFAIRGIPTLIIFKNGQEMARQSGAMAASDLQNWILQQTRS